MTVRPQTYMEHAAIRVKDIHWHIRFFKEALGMSIRHVEGPEDNPKQVWFFGGVQLVSDPGFEGPEGRCAHLGIMTEDLEASIEAVNRLGGAPMPQGRNWVALPDGLAIELLQASGNSVAEALAVRFRG